MIPEGVKALAIRMAEKSTMKYMIGAVIFNGYQIIGMGYNRRLKDREGKRATVKFGVPYYSIHAEVAAIQWAIKKFGADQLIGCDMYIYRLNNNKALPCECCKAIIEAVGIRNVYYSDR
jgi:tRNA(Arg) A34 adenosine deaminase TadA